MKKDRDWYVLIFVCVAIAALLQGYYIEKERRSRKLVPISFETERDQLDRAACNAYFDYLDRPGTADIKDLNVYCFPHQVMKR